MRISLSWAVLFLVSVAGLQGCRTASPHATLQDSRSPAARTQRDFDFVSYFDLSKYTGKTYLAFMTDEVKPAMDKIATEGYVVKGGATMEVAYGAVHSKVQRKVDRDFGGIDTVKEIADALEGQTVNLNNLPQKIKEVNSRVDIYDLSTFIGLASGGGVKIKYATDNYALNVHYDKKEQRSGRSFGVGPTRAANDASDKEYLDDLEAYVRGSRDNLGAFYQAMFESLLNSDPSHYSEVSPEGQTVLTDFLAVFTAEQARNLMDRRIEPHWDAALLEVTLLGAFHAGQSKVKLYWHNSATDETSFTDKTLPQARCEAPSGTPQQARLRDYWQFSRNINDQSNCGRSGINITKQEFRKLGTRITAFVYTNHRAVFDKVKAGLGIDGPSMNLFESLSEFLINDATPKKLKASKVKAITDSWVEFLNVATENANAITGDIQRFEISGN